MEQINIIIFKFINEFAGKNAVLDASAIFLAEYTPYLFIIILAYFWFFKTTKHKHVVLFTVYATSLSLLISKTISLFYFHERPFVMNLGKNIVEHAPDSSFPSDHTVFLFSIAFVIYLFSNKKTLPNILVAMAFLGGLSRIFVGVHFPFDILASAIVVLVSSFTVYFLRQKLLKLNNFFIKIHHKVFS